MCGLAGRIGIQRHLYIPYYIHQFGRIRFKGADFLVRILKRYVAATLPFFPPEEGRAQVESILLTAEVVQYKRQLADGKAYSWEDYLAELSQGTTLWNETLMAFRDALVNLDFKPLWKSERLEELFKNE